MAEVLIISGAGCYSDPWHAFADTSRCLADIIAGLGHDVTVSEAVEHALAEPGEPDLLVINIGNPREARPQSNIDAAERGLEGHLARGGALLGVHAQYHSREGPCLDAVVAPLVYAQSFPDERWPTLASRPTESGVRSALSYRLAAASSANPDSNGGSLNSYGVVPDAFSDAAQEMGFILAAFASVAVRAVDERNTLQGLGRDLQQAMLSRDVIGQAKGILMERLKCSPEDAFDLLRRASQRLNMPAL